MVRPGFMLSAHMLREIDHDKCDIQGTKPEFIFSIFLFLASSVKVSEALFTMFHDASTFICSSILQN